MAAGHCPRRALIDVRLPAAQARLAVEPVAHVDQHAGGLQHTDHQVMILCHSQSAQCERVRQRRFLSRARLKIAAVHQGAAVMVTGFGTAFAIHFTSRPTLMDYRDTLEDDTARLRRDWSRRTCSKMCPTAR